jgi:hypothetical protein
MNLKTIAASCPAPLTSSMPKNCQTPEVRAVLSVGATMDEGVKVCIITHYEDRAITKGMQTAQPGSGEFPIAHHVFRNGR